MSEVTERLSMLAGETAHAARNGIFLTPLWRPSPGDGDLASVKLAMVCEEMAPGGLYRTELSFPTDGERAQYAETHATEEGTTGLVHDLPYDFSDGYRVRDIWEGETMPARDPSWKELDGPRELIEFVADRMAERFRGESG